MHLLCTLSRHRAAPVTLENQGFLFSRCQRCTHDLVSSASGPPSWQAVPDGFRVAWRQTDLSVFAQTPMTHRALGRIRKAGTTARDVIGLAATIIRWRTIDGARTLKTRALTAYRTSKATLRLPNLRKQRETCVVIVNLTLRRDLGPDALSVLLRDPGATAHA
ncbi:hypothetical protein U1701_09675 [Sphingomonas sp. PB2P19]|uniref:hypothetical protein n=1 Tax=Sphingomonas rhamnosi TaxID=3096156 RepID=UPI002FC8A809